MKCPKCQFEQTESNECCPKCGIYFEKYNFYHAVDHCVNTDHETTINYQQPLPRRLVNYPWSALLLDVDNKTEPLYFIGRLLVFLLLFVLTWTFALLSIEELYFNSAYIFLSKINLPFHEAGHVLFSFFGRFITSLGGTLGQLLIPAICLGTFLFKYRNTFAASVSLWWFGENFMDIATYMNDARAGVLPLVGGGSVASSPYGRHDWNFLFTETGLLQADQQIASLTAVTGIFIMCLALFWGGWLLFKQSKRLY